MNYRIRRYDRLNWVLERFVPAGTGKPGRGGRVSQKDRWVNEGYYNRPEYAARNLLYALMGDQETAIQTFAEWEAVIERAVDGVALSLVEVRP